VSARRKAPGPTILVNRLLLFAFLAVVGVATALVLVFYRAGRVPQPSTVPLFGEHQAGVATTQQSFAFVAAFDVTTKSVAELRALLQEWTAVSARMAAGRPAAEPSSSPLSPPADTGETSGYAPARLTMTFGAGPSLFDDRFGLSRLRPSALVDIPPFAGDRLVREFSDGDLGVQICADDVQVAFHALRELIRVARGTAVLRWSQAGFRPTEAANTKEQTARNLQGFKDGTVNIDTKNTSDMNRVVWARQSDGAGWMAGGTYLVVRRIRMRIEVWDRSSLQDQEATIGRNKESGAPLGGAKELDALNLTKEASGVPIIPEDAHVRLAHGNGTEQIFRRPYAFANGMDTRTGELDSGLLYLVFQRDPRKQFIPIQERLAASDALNEYIAHVGSAIFAIFPGAKAGGYVGETLLH